MWKYIQNLPTELVGQKILSFLDLKSIALLERALTCPDRLTTLHSFLKISPSFPESVVIDMIDEITLHVQRIILTNQLDMLSVAAYKKCCTVHITDKQDSATMVILFSRLKSMHTLITF